MSRFRPNPHLAGQLRRLQAGQLAAAKRQVAEPARQAADQIARQAGAPWMPKHRGAGDAVTVQIDGDRVRLVLRGYGAHLTEFGSRNNPPHAPLRRGVLAAGLRLVEDSGPTS